MELIDREALMNAIVKEGQASKRYKIGETWELNGGELREVIYSLPTIESRPTGHWIDIIEPITDPKVNFFERLESRDTPRAYKCDNCGRIVESKENFCPRCGAKMEGSNENVD